jgi:hypothetical protein
VPPFGVSVDLDRRLCVTLEVDMECHLEFRIVIDGVKDNVVRAVGDERPGRDHFVLR